LTERGNTALALSASVGAGVGWALSVMGQESTTENTESTEEGKEGSGYEHLLLLSVLCALSGE
jgi:hypothetical protein